MPHKGDRIELIHTNDQHTKLKKGDRGTVVREITGTIHPYVRAQIIIKWDSGSNLILLDPIDSYKVIKED